MCKQLGIARAAFYKWKHRIIPQQERENQEIAELIKGYDERFSHILGYRRMTDWLNHQSNTFFQKENPSDYEKARNTFCHPQKEEKVQYF